MQASLKSATAAIREEFSVEIVDGPETLRERRRLCRQLWRLQDAYETNLCRAEHAGGGGCVHLGVAHHRAHHVVVRHRTGGRMAGLARLVLPSPETPNDILPLQRVCDPCITSRLPLRETAEVSHFILSPALKAMSPASQGLLRLSLIRGVAMLTERFGLSHLCALVEPSLRRLLPSIGIHLSTIGPSVEYRGIRQLAFCQIDELLYRMRQEQPAAWGFITDAGRLPSHWLVAPGDTILSNTRNSRRFSAPETARQERP